MKVVETIGTIQIIETSPGWFIARCPNCNIGTDQSVGQTAINIFKSLMRQNGGKHNGCNGPMIQVENRQAPEFVAHMVCKHWIAGVDLDGDNMMPKAGDSIICPACDAHREIEFSHRMNAACHLGGCEKMDIRLAVPVESSVVEKKT
jgi:hypothetical protein